EVVVAALLGAAAGCMDLDGAPERVEDGGAAAPHRADALERAVVAGVGGLVDARVDLDQVGPLLERERVVEVGQALAAEAERREALATGCGDGRLGRDGALGATGHVGQKERR